MTLRMVRNNPLGVATPELLSLEKVSTALTEFAKLGPCCSWKSYAL